MKGDQIFDNPLVAFDNSQHSFYILDIIDSMKPFIPKISILHVHNSKKLYLNDRFKGPAIFNNLKDRYPSEKNGGISVELKDNADKNTNLIILQNSVAKSSSILFLGFVGSKGLKPRNCDLSSRIRQFVYESKFNLAIIKQPKKELKKVLFLLDGSETSFQGLYNVIAFCKRFFKELTVLHAFNEDLKKNCKHIKILLKKVQEERSDFKFEQLFEEKALLTAVKERQASFEWVVLNKNGYRGSINKQRFVGSNTSQILEEVNCNLIIFA